MDTGVSLNRYLQDFASSHGIFFAPMAFVPAPLQTGFVTAPGAPITYMPGAQARIVFGEPHERAPEPLGGLIDLSYAFGAVPERVDDATFRRARVMAETGPLRAQIAPLQCMADEVGQRIHDAVSGGADRNAFIRERVGELERLGGATSDLVRKAFYLMSLGGNGTAASPLSDTATFSAAMSALAHAGAHFSSVERDYVKGAVLDEMAADLMDRHLDMLRRQPEDPRVINFRRTSFHQSAASCWYIALFANPAPDDFPEVLYRGLRAAFRAERRESIMHSIFTSAAIAYAWDDASKQEAARMGLRAALSITVWRADALDASDISNVRNALTFSYVIWSSIGEETMAKSLKPIIDAMGGTSEGPVH